MVCSPSGLLAAKRKEKKKRSTVGCFNVAVPCCTRTQLLRGCRLISTSSKCIQIGNPKSNPSNSCTVQSPSKSLAHGCKWRSASNLTGFQRSYRRLGLRRGLRDGVQPLCQVPSTAKAIWATGRMALDRGQEVPTFCTLRLARPCLTSTGPRCLGLHVWNSPFFDESEDVINVLLCCATGCYAMLSYCINSMGFVSEHCLPFHGTLGSSQMYMHVLDLSNWIGWFTDPTPFAPVQISRAPGRYLTVPPDASPNSVLMSQVHLAQSPLVPSTSVLCLCLV